MPTPVKIKFLNKEGDWVEETCHDPKTCREHSKALQRTQKMMTLARKALANLQPEELEALEKTIHEETISLNDYESYSGTQTENFTDRLQREIAENNPHVPEYVRTSLSEIVYYMDDLIIYNMNSESEEEELTLGDIYLNPELTDENQTEIAELIRDEFNLFGQHEGYTAEIHTQSYNTSEHSVVKITTPEGDTWVADFNLRMYDKNQPFPLITTFDEWDKQVDSIVKDERYEE